MHFDTLPLTDSIYVAYGEPEFDSGLMSQEITMPEKKVPGNDAVWGAFQWCR